MRWMDRDIRIKKYQTLKHTGKRGPSGECANVLIPFSTAFSCPDGGTVYLGFTPSLQTVTSSESIVATMPSMLRLSRCCTVTRIAFTIQAFGSINGKINVKTQVVTTNSRKDDMIVLHEHDNTLSMTNSIDGFSTLINKFLRDSQLIGIRVLLTPYDIHGPEPHFVTRASLEIV